MNNQELKTISSIDEYLDICKETALYPNIKSNFYYTLLGALGELGEVANKYKKILRDKNGIISEEDKQKLIDELGDTQWYIAMCCYELDVQPSEMLTKNIEKLLRRRKNNTISGSGDNR